MGNVFNLNARREIKASESDLAVYRIKILKMDKLELLHEMVVFQETRSKNGGLNLELIRMGIVLFKALEEHAETSEMRLLTRSYHRHLEYELDAILKSDRGL
jgi:hypothetical protein